MFSGLRACDGRAVLAKTVGNSDAPRHHAAWANTIVGARARRFFNSLGFRRAA